jgi:hypothetical protein
VRLYEVRWLEKRIAEAFDQLGITVRWEVE